MISVQTHFEKSDLIQSQREKAGSDLMMRQTVQSFTHYDLVVLYLFHSQLFLKTSSVSRLKPKARQERTKTRGKRQEISQHIKEETIDGKQQRQDKRTGK